GERAAAIRHAVERGVSFFDTAPTYGAGESERLLGRVLKADRERVAIATKVGPRDEPRGSLEASLRRLDTDYVDIVQLHETLERWEWQLEKLHALQRAGRSLIGLALGWLCARPGVSIVLVGAKNAAQVDETFVPDPRPLTPDTCRAIDAIVADVFRPATGTPQLGDAARTWGERERF